MFFVVARYKEDIQWVRDSEYEYQIVQKGIDMPNIGREPASYMHWIIENYDVLKGHYVFCQGNPFTHCIDILEQAKHKASFKLLNNDETFGKSILTCDRYGLPQHAPGHKPGVPKASLDLHAFSSYLKLPLRDTYDFIPGCQFMISAEKLKSKPLQYYIDLYTILTLSETAPWEFERLLGYLFI